MTVLIILAVLFIALVVIIPMIERSKTRFSQQDVAKLSRWILPLLVILVLAQLFVNVW